MDAKQACDKLNGFNFQSRYLVGKWIKYVLVKRMLANIAGSSVSPTREDAQVERGPGGKKREFRAAQEAARYRITIRRACGT